MSSDTKKNSIKTNYIFNLTYQIFLLLTPLITTPYVSRVLTAVGNGQISYTASYVAYFTLIASMGFAIYGQRAIAQSLSDECKNSIKNTFWEIVFLRLITTVLALVAYAIFIVSNFYNTIYFTLFIVHSITIISVAFDVSFFFQGIENFKIIVVRNFLIKVITITCIFLFVKSKDDLIMYLIIEVLGTFLGAVSLWAPTLKIVGKPCVKEIRLKRHVRPSLILFLPTIAGTIYANVDKTMIGLLTANDAENGYYLYAERLVRMALTVVTSLGAVMIPNNSKKYVEGDIIGLKRNIRLSARYVIMIGLPICLGIVAVANNIIPWLLSSMYMKTADLMKILSVNVLIIGLSQVLGYQYLIPTKRDGKYAISVGVGAVVNVVANYLLIRMFGCMGAVIATVISEFSILCVMYLFIKSEISLKLVAIDSFKYFISGFIMFVIISKLGCVLSPSIINSILLILLGVLIYSIMLILIKDSFFMDLVKKTKVKIYEKIKK